MTVSEMYKRNTDPGFWGEHHNWLNCGSFALNVTSWYCPYIEEEENIDEFDALWQYTDYERTNWIEEMVMEGAPREDIMECIIDRDFHFILMTCPWLEPISVEEIQPEDRVIAYRLSMELDEPDCFSVGCNMDFHFRVQIDGEWWEKNGGGPIHYVSDEPIEEPWEVEDWLVYDGPIRYAKFREDV